MEVLCLGESMAVLAPSPAGSLRASAELRVGVAGAESNVAIGLALLGADVAWRGKVGDDPFGHRVLDALRASGVDCSGVEVDPDRPTGVYFKDPAGETTRVHYYRTGSAASTMGPGFLDGDTAPRLLHLTGITPALSGSCDALVRELVLGRSSGAGQVSFDVNYRPALWHVDAAAPVLALLADAADIAFVGLDEARTLWGCEDPAAVRRALPEVETLVVKDGGTGVTCFSGEATVFEPAESAEVVEPVGAGDAFAAGFLYGRLRGSADQRSLRLGHRLAVSALQTVGDIGAPPDHATVTSILESA